MNSPFASARRDLPSARRWGHKAARAGFSAFRSESRSLTRGLILESQQPMRLSRYFLPILKETPKEAEIVSHRLMLRAGMIRQEAAGIYAWLPLGLRVLHKISAIVREEQNRAGAIELLMPTIQSADLWRESGRYDDYGKEMLRIRDRHERDMLFGPTNEEMITEIFRANVRSYKDLPLNLYHIQWKFRDEVRPRFGVMRSREFLMKDAYSFDLDAAGARHSYNKMFAAYLRTFARFGLTAIPMVADTGPIGGDLSPRIHHPRRHRRERSVLPQGLSRLRAAARRRSTSTTPARCRASFDQWTSLYAATSERHDAAAFDALPAGIAHFGARHRSRPYFLLRNQVLPPMKAVVNGPDGKERSVHMGSYGIGPSRARGGADRGQPRRSGHDLAGGGGAVRGRPRQSQGRRRGLRRRLRASSTPSSASAASTCSTTIATSGPARNSRRMDLIGLPRQVIVGPKSLAEGKVEIKNRRSGERELVSSTRRSRKLGGKA